jgi:hypothetical protein
MRYGGKGIEGYGVGIRDNAIKGYGREYEAEG